jgi:hypothetical protein
VDRPRGRVRGSRGLEGPEPNDLALRSQSSRDKKEFAARGWKVDESYSIAAEG